jgi:hypothetical protein
MRPVVPVLGLTVALVLGCGGFGKTTTTQAEPTWASYPQRIDALVGHRIHEATEWLGTPTKQEDLPAEAKRYTWDWRIGTPNPTAFDCLTVIEADQSGKITMSHAEGSRCIGVPPRGRAEEVEATAPVEPEPTEAPAGDAPRKGGPKAPGVAAPTGSEGPIRVHRAGNVDPLNGGSLEPTEDQGTLP